jgi:hypothetical protein
MVATSIRPVRQSGIDRLEPRHLLGQREPHSGQPDSRVKLVVGVHRLGDRVRADVVTWRQRDAQACRGFRLDLLAQFARFLAVAGIDRRVGLPLCGRHGKARSHRGEVDQGFRPRKARRGGRIPPARGTCWASGGRGDSFQGVYCGGGVPREEPARAPPHDQRNTCR